MVTKQDTTDSTKTDAGTEIEKRVRFDPTDLRSIVSFDDAKRLAEAAFGDIVDAAHEIGDGFTMCEDKTELVKNGFLILAWAFTPGDFGEDYAIMRVFTADARKLVVVDGGTGIAAQLREYEARTGRTGGMLVENGLRKSEYDNEHGHGVTFYLNV